MAGKGTSATSLKEYLKKYVSNDEEDTKKKKKKKKPKQEVSKVLLVDADPVWHKPVNLDLEEESNDSGEEKPQVDEDIEVKRLKRLEQIKSRRPYNAISEDGSGWVSVSDTPTLPNSDLQNIDMSPRRRGRARFDTPSPEPVVKNLNTHEEDKDLSPNRKHRRQDRDSLPEHVREPSAATLFSQDISPPRRRRQEIIGNSENSFQRRKDADISPSHRGRQSSAVPDSSPPRQGRQSSATPDLSPPRRGRQNSAAPALSPPRRGSHSSPAPDLSPPRRRRQSSPDPDLSPPRKKRLQSSHFDSDNSPPRGTRPQSTYHRDKDLSPPRKNRSISSPLKDLSPSRENRRDSARPSAKERPKTGLVSGKDIKEEISRAKKNELLRFQEMDPSASGRGAEAVYRDKNGKRITREEYLKSKKGEEKPKEKKLEWGKGLAQKREAEERLQEMELEKDKPFARTRDDPELDELMKDRVRWGDPMAHLVKKKDPQLNLPNLGEDTKMKESGFIVPQDIPNHSWLKRGLDAAPNRYGIRPGRHWDGVDRSTGYEKSLFKRMNEKQATEREAYLWSVSDM